jgi:hypothetical protein
MLMVTALFYQHARQSGAGELAATMVGCVLRVGLRAARATTRVEAKAGSASETDPPVKCSTTEHHWVAERTLRGTILAS